MRSTSSTRSRSIDLRRRCLLSAAAGLALAGCGRQQAKVAALPPGSSVLALGDSLTFGTGATPGQDYPALLAQRTGWNVINAGVPGDRSTQAAARLPALLARHQPQLVLLSIGGNDFLRQVPEAETRAQIEAMLQSIRGAGSAAVLIAIPRLTVASALLRSLDDHPLYEELAQAHRVPLLAGVWSEILADPALKSDRIHANAAGYGQFAEQLHRRLRELGFAS